MLLLCLISTSQLSDECFISLTLYDGNDTSSPTIATFCSTDDPRQSSRQTTNLNFTSSGSQLTVWLRGQQTPTTTPSTAHLPPPRHLPARMSFAAAFAFVDSTAVSLPSSSSSSSSSSSFVSTSSERPYADSRLQLHAADNDNASNKSSFFVRVFLIVIHFTGNT